MQQPVKLLDVVCLGCGCLCDDLRVTPEQGAPASVEPGCALGSAWFHRTAAWAPQPCLVDGQPTAPAQAAARAAELLLSAARPVVCGLRGVDVNAARLAVAIAERLGGCVDWTTSRADLAAIESFQTHGAVEASLGEVAQRADLVVFWRCDPATTHPRHFQRYSLAPRSGWLPAGRTDRTVVAVGAGAATSRQADVRAPLAAGESLAALSLLRSGLAVRGTGRRVVAPPGQLARSMQRLAGLIRESRLTAIFYDAGLQSEGHAALGALTLLAQQAQSVTRIVTLPLGGGDNAVGAQRVMAWQTGFPAGVSFGRGVPDYGPGEFTTEALLLGGEADAALVVAAEGLDGLSDAALRRLRGLPSVVLGSSDRSDLNADVSLSVAPLGARPGGSVMRSDGAILPLRHALSESGPTHAETLAGLLALLGRQEVATSSAAGPSAGGAA